MAEKRAKHGYPCSKAVSPRVSKKCERSSPKSVFWAKSLHGDSEARWRESYVDMFLCLKVCVKGACVSDVFGTSHMIYLGSKFFSVQSHGPSQYHLKKHHLSGRKHHTVVEK